MHLLVLGGTVFVGRAVVEEALGRGWRVTTFNRGISNPDVTGVQAARGDRGDLSDVKRLVKSGPWDAVVDTTSYVPRNALSVARELAPVVGRYVVVSTVSAYADWPSLPLSEDSPLLACPVDAGSNFGRDIEDGPTKYGYQKAGCEMAVRLAVGNDRVSVLRPGVILGPREYVGRLPWWLRRVALGGRMAAPGQPERSIQPIDVRDLAEFALRCVEQQINGAFNITAPIGRDTFRDFLTACAFVTGAAPEIVWVPDVELVRAGVRQWSEMPLWRTSPGVWRVNSSRAVASGLMSRPLAETVRDTWGWLVDTGNVSEGEDSGEIGLSQERERVLLTSIST